MTRLAREPTLNPNVHVYHTTAELTTAVVDDFWGPAELRRIPGVARATANRYRLRVWRVPGAAWEAILGAADPLVLAAVGARALEGCPPDGDDYRVWPLRRPQRRKQVFEGVRAAVEDPLAAALFGLEGVAEVIVDARQVTVRKGRLFAWSDLEGPAAQWIQSFP
jgi:hypothetical protein